MNDNTTMKENVLAGAVGAFLFALVGGILWFVLYQLGYLAAISGLVGVICAVKGQTFFATTKNESKTCIILSVIIAVAVLAISWYLCVAYDVYLAYQDWYAAGEVDKIRKGEKHNVSPLGDYSVKYLNAFLALLLRAVWLKLPQRS